MKGFVFLLAVCCVTCLVNASVSETDQMVVHLPTESVLLPLHLTEFEDVDSGFSLTYLKQLRDLLSFDLNHNGMTYTLCQNAVSGKLPSGPEKYAKLCKLLKVYYLVKVQVKNKTLAARLYIANNHRVKGIDGLVLQGNIERDRKVIHQLADAIHKELFGKTGIASTHILYTVRTQIPGKNRWRSEVWEADYDGANARQITRDGGYCVTPTYLPPSPGHLSSSFLYVSYQTGQPKIYLASRKNGKAQRLTYLRGNQLMPAVTRQRDQLAFICDVAGNPDLFIQTFSPEQGLIGKPMQVFASHLATQGTPAFSPDGKKIAFVSNKDGSARIYLMETPSSAAPVQRGQAKLLTKYSRGSTAPCWSPDGTKIAYCANTAGVRQIWIYDFVKAEERQLTRGPRNKENPTWAPNSLHLVFNSSDAGDCELFLMNLNQPETIKISSGVSEKRFPSWEPRG